MSELAGGHSLPACLCGAGVTVCLPVCVVLESQGLGWVCVCHVLFTREVVGCSLEWVLVVLGMLLGTVLMDYGVDKIGFSAVSFYCVM